MTTFAFHVREPMDKQLQLATALAPGAAMHGDEVVVVDGFEHVCQWADGLVLLGIGGLGADHALLPFNAYRAAGKRVLFFDKGYTRNDNFRVAIDDFQPLAYLMKERKPHDRLQVLGIGPKPARRPGNVILFDGASEKFCAWKSFPSGQTFGDRYGDWRAWGIDVVGVLRQFTKLPIVYRPRPGHNGAPTLPGVETSTLPLEQDLARAHVVVSWGGNIGFDCVVAGVPHFALGDSIARPVSETDLGHLDEPYLPGQLERYQWLANVAYCQWSLGEFADGSAWAHIKNQMQRL